MKDIVARAILVAFILTFIAARVTVFLIVSRRLPDIYLHLRGTHVHHLNYGIFLLSGVGAYLLLMRPDGRRLFAAAIVYGVGLVTLGQVERSFWSMLEAILGIALTFFYPGLTAIALLAVIATRAILRRHGHSDRDGAHPAFYSAPSNSHTKWLTHSLGGDR
jgi:hypothetical protein